MNSIPYPKSFPNKNETRFLNVLLCSDAQFPALFDAWKKSIIFDDIDYATLRLLPLLYTRLRKLGFNAKDSTLMRIQGIYKLAWVKNQQLLNAVEKTVLLFKENNIPVLLLKGIPLLLEVYKDTGARFLSDADLLINPSNIKKAITLMHEAGWKLHTRQFPSLDRFSDESLPRIVKEVTFINEQRTEIDVHWRIFESLGEVSRRESMLFDAVWANALLAVYKNTQYNILSFEDMLIHVIVHGAEGSPNKTLRWVTDAVAIIHTATINWNLFFEKTKKYDFTVEIYLAFAYLLEHTFIVLPEPIVHTIFSLPLPTKNIKLYYRKANNMHIPWGGLPRLWRTYWDYESKGVSPIHFYYFLEYLSGAWGLPNKRSLIPFVLNKYKKRVSYLIKRRILSLKFRTK